MKKTIKDTSPDSGGSWTTNHWRLGAYQIIITHLSHILLSLRPSLLPSVLEGTTSGGLEWTFSYSSLHNQFVETDTNENFPLLEDLGIHRLSLHLIL